MEDSIFNDKNKMKAEFNTLKFGKLGDWMKGTLTDNTRQIVNNLSPKKEMQTIFEFKIQGGSIHLINKKIVDENPTVLEKGSFWSFITSNDIMLRQFKAIKLGQSVGLRFNSTKEAKQPGHNDAKIIDIYPGEMDPTYQGETSSEVKAA